jgi:citrate lyase beta subunit
VSVVNAWLRRQQPEIEWAQRVLDVAEGNEGRISTRRQDGRLPVILKARTSGPRANELAGADPADRVAATGAK